MRDGGVDASPFWSQISILKDCYLQNTNFLSLSNKESITLGAIVTVHVSGKQRKMKAVPVLIRLLHSFTHLVLDVALDK